ncbi:MAG: potassium transporter TrkA [Chloroflexi bacterium HGW-Chloroflexi-5]|jgi:trk system potassium uptake protein TrkA|nr:MAG: potassium transporter TrkA [Chloroflexi bacterium HGW-Chloroflexi-5]
MFVIIAGGGRTGAQLARSLLSENHTVHVIEHRKEVLTRIHKELPTEVIFPGNALDTQVLEQAGIKEAQVFAATTTSDAENLSLCFLVKERYKINRTIARVNNPRDAWLFDSKFNVDVAVNQADILSRLIQEEMSLGDMMTLLKLKRGRYSLVEEKIPSGSKVCGVSIKDLKLPASCVIAAILRHGEIVLPRGTTVLKNEDEVLAITDTEGARQLAAILGNAE